MGGFDKGDAWVAGMITQQALVVASLPVTAAVAWYVHQQYPNSFVLAVSVIVFVGLCAYFLLGLIPMTISLILVGIMELVTHQVVVFLAIIADKVVFFGMWNPTSEEAAMWALGRMWRNVHRLAPRGLRNVGASLTAGASSPTRPLLDTRL